MRWNDRARTAGPQGSARRVLLSDSLDRLDHKARLAHAALTNQGDNLAVSRRRAPPTVEQDGGFVLPVDEWSAGRAARLQAGYLALSDDLIDGHRRREALELAPAQIAILEPFRRELPRDFGHDNGIGFGHALQTSGEVGRLADNGVAIRVAAGNGVAHNDQAGRNADPYSDVRIGELIQLWFSLVTAPTSSSPARTALSALSSCATGNPK